MSHLAARYCQDELLPKQKSVGAENFHINHLQSDKVMNSLFVDADSYYYSACVSCADAMNGLKSGYYSWSTVKLYYSVFYGLRCLLALGGVTVFYDKTKPKILRALAGGQIQNPPNSSRERTSHGVVLETFKWRFPDHPLLSQDIAGEEPLSWLKARREDMNYAQARFTEPDAPTHFRILERMTVRKLVNAYVADDVLSYAFDKDHAMIAYPVEVLKEASQELEAKGQCSLSMEDFDFLSGAFRDDTGPIPSLAKVIKRD